MPPSKICVKGIEGFPGKIPVALTAGKRCENDLLKTWREFLSPLRLDFAQYKVKSRKREAFTYEKILLFLHGYKTKGMISVYLVKIKGNETEGSNNQKQGQWRSATRSTTTFRNILNLPGENGPNTSTRNIPSGEREAGNCSPTPNDNLNEVEMQWLNSVDSQFTQDEDLELTGQSLKEHLQRALNNVPTSLLTKMKSELEFLRDENPEKMRILKWTSYASLTSAWIRTSFKI